MFDNIFVWAQVIGCGGLLLNIISWQLKTPRNIIVMTIPSNFLWATHYIMLGAPLGAITNLCSVIRNTGLVIVRDHLVPYFIYSFLLLTWVIGLYFYEFWYDVLPLVSASIMNLGLLRRNNRPLIARTTVIYCILGLIYDVIVGSLVGFICGIFIVASAIIGMYRHENWNLNKSPINLFKSLFIPPPATVQEAAHV